MAFYLALFNVNHVNDEVKHSVAHARRSKSMKPVLKDKNRRHSLSSTQDVADYRLLPRPRIIGSSSNLRLRRSPSPPPPNRRTSAADAALCTCDTDSPDNGRKKVTFDGGETSMLMVEKPRRKLSDGSFLENREQLLSQSPMESSSQKAAEWIYSIRLENPPFDKNRRHSQQGLTAADSVNQIRPSTSSQGITFEVSSRSSSPPPTAIQTQTALRSPGPSIVLPIQCDHYQHRPQCGGGRHRCGIDCAHSSNANPAFTEEPLYQKRPQSRLPSILRRRSTSDRSASLSVVFRRALPYRNSSPNPQISIDAMKQSRIPIKLKSHYSSYSHHHHRNSDDLPLIEKDSMIRSNYY